MQTTTTLTTTNEYISTSYSRRDKTMKKISEKFAARNAVAAETRKVQLQERQRIMREKNELAEENERAQREKEQEAKQRSEQAIANLIESRKRRRR